MSRYRAVLGLDRAPSGLGLLFLLSMVHELARADSTELTSSQLAELSGRLAVQRDELLAMVDVIRSSYPEISDQLYGEEASEVTGGRGDEVDLLALAEEITALEESGYLDHEEILRLRNALKALQEEAWLGDDVIVAQAGASETPAGESRAGAGEGSAAGAEETAVDIDALPPTGAGPLVALGPLLAGGAATIAAVNIIGDRGSSAAPVDSTAPVYVSTSTSIAHQTITLTYSEPLSTTGTPLASSFSVQTRAIATDPWGASVAIDSVSVSGSTVILDLTGTPLQTGQLLRITYTDPAGDAANAIQDAAGNDAATVVVTMGIVADGYVRGAQIYIDANGDGVAQASERLEGVTTDANGNFFLPDSVGGGAILAVGGVNIDTGVVNTIVLKAPAGSIMISPLTTLVQSYIEQNGGSAASANAAVTSALGITLPAGQTLTTYDPLAALAANGSDLNALGVQKAAAQVATIVQAAAAQPSGGASATTVANNVIANLVNQIEAAAGPGGTTVNLADTATITTVLSSVPTTVTVTEVQGATVAIADADFLSEISTAQAALLDTTTPVAPIGLAVVASSDTGTSNADGDTRDATPTVRVTLNVTATDGTAAVVGNTVTIYAGATQLGSTTLTSNHIANGHVDITLSTLSVGEHNLRATVTDNARPAHVSADSALYNVTIESGVPVAPGFSLAVDSGVSNTDGITNNGAVSVSGLEPGASFQYSTDGGSQWTTGSGSSFTLPGPGFYQAGSVQVRQTDAIGTVGAVAANAANITVGNGTPLTIASATEASTLAALLAQGNQDGYLRVLDLEYDNISITAAQATSLVGAGIEFAANDTVTVNAEGTPLQTSLSNLQKLGVDVINVGVGVGGVGYGIAGGEGLDYGALPTINADAAMRVGLEVPDGYFGTLTAPESINAAALKAAGFDAIFAADGSLTLDATQTGEIRDADLGYRLSDDITMSIRPAGEASAIESIVGRIDAGQFTNGAIDFLDVFDNGISITAAQATSLVDAGIEFAANDTVTVNAEGTQLQTSLSNLQKLGVDVINVGAGVGGVGYGIAGGEGLDYGALPTINAGAGVRVGLLVADGTLGGLTDPEIAQFGANADALATAGFDALFAADGSLTIDAAQARELREAGLGYRLSDEVTMSIRPGGETTAIETLTTQINNNQFTIGAVDVLDVVDNSISISDAQASALVGAGLQFAANDTGVAIQATGTHLSTSLTDLQRLGVDFVHTGGGVDTVVLDWGSSGGVSNTLPVFDSEDQVKVSVRDSDLDEVVSFLSAGGHNTPNIDVLSVALRDAFGPGADILGLAGVTDPLFQINNMGIELNASVDQMVTLGMILNAADGSNDSLAALYGLSGQTLATGLTAAGISNIHVDAMTHFEVTDGDLNALLNAGLVSANVAADVTVTNTDGTLDVTLAQLANIGANQVQTSDASPQMLQVDAGVSFSTGAELTAALSQLVATFEAQGGGTVQQLFEAADTVDLRVAGSLPSFELGAELTTKLQLLGIDDIKDANGLSIKPNP